MVDAVNPVIFEKNETEFTNQGIGTLECVSCLVTEERNGIYELVAKVRKESKHFNAIVEGNIIVATHSNKQDRQPFQIYKITRTIDGFVEVRAEHISYRLARNTVMPYRAETPSAAILGLWENAVEYCPFAFITDMDGTGTFEVTKPENIRAMLTGKTGSLTDVYKGGEYEFDCWSIKYLKERGRDKGVSIRYGKNMTDLSKETDIADIYTSIVPYWSGVDKNQDDVTVTIPEKVVDSLYVDIFPTRRTVPIDLSGEFEDIPTVEELRTAAQQYIDDNVRQQLLSTIKAKFIDLTITDEYKGMFDREGVDLCDTVTVSYPGIGVKDKAKVTRVVYNVLLDRYDSIELGDSKKTLSDLFGNRPSLTRGAAKQMVKKEKEAREELQDKVRELEEKLNSFELPIGYVYLSVTNVNPGEYFPGTWERISEGYYLKGVEGSDAAEETGGDTNGHVHDFSITWKNFIQLNVGDGNMDYFRYPTEAAIPGHVKSQTLEGDPLEYVEVNIADGTPGITVDINQNVAGQKGSPYSNGSWKTTNVGETEPAVSEPPYFTVYAWKRIA